MLRNNVLRRCMAFVMSLVFFASILPVSGLTEKAHAAAWTKTVAGIGSSAIKAPKTPASESSAWTGSYVWYGRYNGEPVKYRVLAPKTTAYGGTTMLLDCDRILYRALFDESSNEWDTSDVKTGLNGSAFLTKSNGFSAVERRAIANSTVASHRIDTGNRLDQELVHTTGLNGEKVFLLDYVDVLNSAYGYFPVNQEYLYDDGGCLNRVKNNAVGAPAWWWLRTDNEYYHYGQDFVAGVNSSGNVGRFGVNLLYYRLYTEPYHEDGYENSDYRISDEDPGRGVSPVFNVDLKSVIFSSVVSGTSGKDNAEYKLTLADNNIAVGLQSGKSISASGRTITVPYVVTGSNSSKVTQVSVLVLDKEYGGANANDASVLYYGKLSTSGSFAVTGTGTFTLPSSLNVSDWGTAYQVYLLAEDVNGVHESDYASVPYRLTAPDKKGFATVSSQPVNVTVTAGSVAKIAVTASGTGTLTYQWQYKTPSATTWKNSGQSGAKTATLSVKTTTGMNGYMFHCVITNGNGKVTTTDAAGLTVNVASSAQASDKTVASLGTTVIKAPSAPANKNSAWTGSYVWYGQYNGDPLRYRVLAPKTTEYGGTTMLLDCDSVIYEADIISKLNEDAFLTKKNVFSDAERDAIAYSTVEGKEQYHEYETITRSVTTDGIYDNEFNGYTGVTSEQVFLLDYEDIMNTRYGYVADCGRTSVSGDSYTVASRLKKNQYGTAFGWLMRTHQRYWGDGQGVVCENGSVGIIGYNLFEGGSYGQFEVGFGYSFGGGGVSPAFNINLPSIIFTSLVSGTAGKNNAEYKLTIVDDALKLRVPSGKTATVSGNTISVPYTITGADASNATQISVLILNKNYTAGNANNATIKYYGKANVTGTFSTKGTATFSLPSDLSMSDWGSSYLVYLLAEDVNGIHETDYASAPIKLSSPGKPVFNTQPKDTRVTSGETAKFTAAATGTGTITYQWQYRKNASASWANSGQSGNKTSTLSVAATANLAGYQFRCVATDGNGKKAYSDYAVLGIDLKITSQPKDVLVQAGDTARFTVTATGTSPLSYQWQYRKDEIWEWANSGQTGNKTATLSVATTKSFYDYQFRCVITDGDGRKVYSDAAVLKIKGINEQTKEYITEAGYSASFYVHATGEEPITYQWQYRKNPSGTWTNSGQSGNKTYRLTVAAKAGYHGYQFRCVITDGNGNKMYSEPATLKIRGVNTQPKSTCVTAGTTAKFTVEVTSGAPSLTYQWEYRRNSDSEWKNSGQSGNKTSTLSVAATAGLHGYQFRCVATDSYGNVYVSDVATLSIEGIHKQPADVTVTAGEKAVFAVEATGKSTLSYQWQYRKNSSSAWTNSGQSGNKTATLSVATKASLNNYQFRCIVTTADGQQYISQTATMTVH